MFYRLEAVHLGDLLRSRYGLRGCHPRPPALDAPSHQARPRQQKLIAALPAPAPPRRLTRFRGLAAVEQKRNLSLAVGLDERVCKGCPPSCAVLTPHHSANSQVTQSSACSLSGAQDHYVLNLSLPADATPLRTDSPMANPCSHGTLLHFSLQLSPPVEYSLLPPRSAPGAAPARLAPCPPRQPPRPPTCPGLPRPDSPACDRHLAPSIFRAS